MLHLADRYLRSLSLRVWVYHPNTCMHVRLLGPCFKTGRLKPFRQHPKRGRADLSEYEEDKTQNACIVRQTTPEHPVSLAREHTLRILSPIHCIAPEL